MNVKTIILIILACICTHVYAQPGEMPQLSATKFLSISEKIKKLPSASSLAKMKPDMGFILSPAKMTAGNNIYIIFRNAFKVTPQEVELDNLNKSHMYHAGVLASFPANMGGIYVFELNIALFRFVREDFNFKITCAGTTQTVTLPHITGGSTDYVDDKLVFAVTIPNSACWVEVITTDGSWKFRNCEITAMK